METLISGKDTHHEEALFNYIKGICAVTNTKITRGPWIEDAAHPLLKPPGGYLHVYAVVEVEDLEREYDPEPDTFDIETEMDVEATTA
jgi:hypothetical protein